MESETPWGEFKQPTSAADPLDNDRVIRMAVHRYEETGKPRGFLVYRGSTYDEARPDEWYRVYRFSPVATDKCKGSIALEPSDAPTVEEMELLKLLVGSTEDERDLLK